MWLKKWLFDYNNYINKLLSKNYVKNIFDKQYFIRIKENVYV